jgi:hypothetical protein
VSKIAILFLFLLFVGCQEYKEPLVIITAANDEGEVCYSAKYQGFWGNTLYFHSKRNLSVGDTVEVVVAKKDTSTKSMAVTDPTIGQVLHKAFK